MISMDQAGDRFQRDELISAVHAADEQIKHMVNRFLGWRLPKPWNPDNGVSYTRPNYAHPPADHDWPIGMNLFTATEAEAMVRYMLDGMPIATDTPASPSPVGDWVGLLRAFLSKPFTYHHKMTDVDIARADGWNNCRLRVLAEIDAIVAAAESLAAQAPTPASEETDPISAPRPGECSDATVLARFEDGTPAMALVRNTLSGVDIAKNRLEIPMAGWRTAFVASNGLQDSAERWLAWANGDLGDGNNYGPQWVDDVAQAMHFARREDVERFSQEAIDCWSIQERPLP